MNYIITGSLVIIILILAILYKLEWEKRIRSEQQMERMTRHWDSKSGGTSLYNGTMINYNLRTWDSGKNWYLVEYDDDWGLSIVGNVEDIYPGLVNYLNQSDKLWNYVKENGPLFENGINEEELELLQGAGFTVQTN